MIRGSCIVYLYVYVDVKRFMPTPLSLSTKGAVMPFINTLLGSIMDIITALTTITNITTNTPRTYHIDFDGTLASDILNKHFNYLKRTLGKKAGLARYKQITNISNLPLNRALLIQLYILKAQGHTLALWTNRGEEHRSMTLTNLGIHNHLFSSHIFGAGEKTTMLPTIDQPRHLIDNEACYLTGTHVTTTTSTTLVDSYTP
jgi:hypothetical protein